MDREQAIDLFKKSSDFAVNYLDHVEVLSLHIIDICLNKFYDDFEEQLKAKDEEIERLKSYVDKLWQILDDIDTYGDMAKSDDGLFRSLVEKKQKKRWELPITTDGYRLIYKDNK